MTDYGRRKIEQAEKNGQWDTAKPPAVTVKQIASLSELLKEFKPAYVATFCLCLYRLKKHIPAHILMRKQRRDGQNAYHSLLRGSIKT